MRVFLKDSKQDILLYFSLFLLFSNYMLFTAFDWGGEDSFNFLKNIIRIVAFFILCLYLGVVGRIKHSIFFSILFVLALFGISGNEILLNILFLLIIFSCLMRIKLDRLIFYIFIFYILYFILHNFLIFTGFLENSISSFDERVRNSYGFSNVNRLGIFYFYFFMLNFYMISHIKGDFYKKIIFYLFALSSLVYIVLSSSRTSLYISVLIIVLWNLSKIDIFHKGQRLILNFIVLFCAGVSFYLASSKGAVFNEILSYRPSFFKQYVDILFSSNFNIIFGAPLSEEITVDNSYILFSGAVGLIVSFLIYFFSPFFSYNKYIPRIYVIMIIASLLCGVFESSLLRVEMLVPIFILFCLFFSRKENFY